VDRTIRIARIAGIDIGVHYTWIIAFFFITWSLSVGFFPEQYPGWPPTLYWVVGGVSAVCLFGSVLAHELTHSFVAIARGLEVKGITLFIFGGVSSIEMDAEGASDEFLVSIVGPLSSLLLAGVFWFLGRAIPPETPLGAIFGYLVLINVLLALFNLLPGFPLDGGRVLRAVLWATTKDYAKATNIAAGVGQAFSFLLIAWGVVQIFSGNFFNGLWTAFVGWFLNGAADASRQEVYTRETFDGVKVADLMEPAPVTIAPDMPVSEVVQEYILRRGWRAIPVCDGSRLLGIVSVTDVKDLDEEKWPTTRVDAVMTTSPLFSVSPSADMTDALKILSDNQIHQVLVTEGDQLLGVLTRAHIVDHLQYRAELGIGRRRG